VIIHYTQKVRKSIYDIRLIHQDNNIESVESVIYLYDVSMNKKDQNMNDKVDENTSTITGDCAILAQK
jgi:hypothetical protein